MTLQTVGRTVWRYLAVAGIHIAIARGDAYLWVPYVITANRERHEIALAFTESTTIIERDRITP